MNCKNKSVRKRMGMSDIPILFFCLGTAAKIIYEVLPYPVCAVFSSSRNVRMALL